MPHTYACPYNNSHFKWIGKSRNSRLQLPFMTHGISFNILLLALLLTWACASDAKRSNKSIAAVPDFDLRCPFVSKSRGVRLCNLAVIEAGSKSTRLHVAEFIFQPAGKSEKGKKSASPKSMRGELRNFRLKSYRSHKPAEDTATKGKGPHELSVDVFSDANRAAYR